MLLYFYLLRYNLVCLCVHLYPPIMRKRRWRCNFWTNPHPLRSCLFPSFPLFIWLLTT